MMYVTDANVGIIDMTHYVMKIKEHEARRASFNERSEYWRAYNEQMGKMVQQPKRND